MSRRGTNRRPVPVSLDDTKKGLFINGNHDDNTVNKRNLPTDIVTNSKYNNNKHVNISDAIGDFELTSPKELSRLKSPMSLVTSPIRLPKRQNTLPKEKVVKDDISDRPLSPRIASPRLNIDNKTAPEVKNTRKSRIPPPVNNNLIYTKSPKSKNISKVEDNIDITPNISTTFTSKVVSPRVVSPRATSPRVVSPRVVSPRVVSPRATSPRVVSPRVVSPRVVSPRATSPELIEDSYSRNIRYSPKVVSPRAASPRIVDVNNSDKRLIYTPKIKRNNVAIIEDVSSRDNTPSTLAIKYSPVSSIPHTIEKIMDGTLITPVGHRKHNKRTLNTPSSRLPKISDRTHITIDRTPPTKISPSRTLIKEEFTPSIGDELMRNGQKYIYTNNGWENNNVNDSSSESEDEEEVIQKINNYAKEPLPDKKTKTKQVDKFMKDIPEYGLLNENQKTYIRTKFNIKFDMIRETWPQYNIPNPSLDMPLEHVHIMYNHYVKHIYARENAQTYMLYVIGGWLVMEIIAVKLLNLPAGKFTEFRMNRMGKYKILLIQLGEKYHGEYGEGWPVEIKILVMSLIEMVLFIAIRWLMSSLSDSGVESSVDVVSNLIDKYFGITGVSNSNSQDNIPPPPSQDIEDIDDDNPGIPRVTIPSLPEEATNVNDALSWLPTITGALGLGNNSKSETPNQAGSSNNTAAKVRERVANRGRRGPVTPNSGYAPPPFDS